VLSAVGDVAADGPGGAGDEDLHGVPFVMSDVLHHDAAAVTIAGETR